VTKPFGRSFQDFPNLSTAERKLVDNCKTGDSTVLRAVDMTALGSTDRPSVLDSRPKSSNHTNIIRADLLRFLLLGGDDQTPVHEVGICLSGAWITGDFNVEGVTVAVGVSLQHCHFDRPLNLRSTQFAGDLEFVDTYVPSIRGDGMTCMRDLFMRDGTESGDGIRFVGATVHGDVDFSGATFRGKNREALALDNCEIKGSLYLRGKFSSEGTVRLVNARIGRDMDCSSAQFDGLYADGKPNRSLAMRSAQIGGALILKNVRLSNVSLADAKVKYLEDESQSWASGAVLNGFQYEAIAHGAPTDCVRRIEWLRTQSPEHLGETDSARTFCPQPWQHLIRTLRSMGHRADAVEVGVAFEHHLRRIGKVGESGEGASVVRRHVVRWVSKPTHAIFGLLAGYGYKPLRLLGSVFGLWVFCALAYWAAARYGLMAPAPPSIFDKDAYATCSPQGANPEGNWYLCPLMKSEFPRFSPFAYSLDVLLPVVNLRQEDNWLPVVPPLRDSSLWEDATSVSAGHAVRLLIWFEMIYGWIASLLLVATMSGFARRNE
jgi:hypothetical protein